MAFLPPGCQWDVPRSLMAGRPGDASGLTDPPSWQAVLSCAEDYGPGRNMTNIIVIVYNMKPSTATAVTVKRRRMESTLYRPYKHTRK